MPTLNVRLAAIIIIGVVVVGGSVHLLHGFQVGRQAQSLKLASEAAEKEREAALEKAEKATSPEEKTAFRNDSGKDLAEAIRLLRDYVKLVRRDHGAELHLGLLLAEAGQLRAAYDALEEGLRNWDESAPPLSPEKVREARWKLVKEVALKIGQFSDAEEHLKTLLDGAVEKNQQHRQHGEKPEGDPEQLDLYGQILLQVKLKPKEAAEVFEDAIAIAPERVDSYFNLALARFQLDQKREAEAVMESMLARNPKSVAAYEKYVAYYHHQAEKAGDAKQRAAFRDIALKKAQQALATSPGDSRCLLLVGHCYMSKQEFDKAEDYLRKGIKASKDDNNSAASYMLLVEVLQRLNKKQDVIDVLKQAIAATRGTPAGLDFRWQLAQAQIDAGNLKEAEALIKDLREERFPPGKTDFLAALVAIQRQNWPLAETLLRDGVLPPSRDPGTRDWPYIRSRANYYLAIVYHQLGRPAKEQAPLISNILDSGLHSPSAHNAMADIYIREGKSLDAAEQLRQAYLSLPANSPQQEDAMINYLRLLVRIRQQTEESKRDWAPVEGLLEKWTSGKSPRPEFEVLKAEVALAQGKPEKAREQLEKCTKDKPKSAAAWLGLVRLATSQAGKETDPVKKEGYWKAAAEYIDRAEKVLGNGLIVRMARGTLALAKKDSPASEILRTLGEKTDGLTESEKVQLWAILGNMSDEAGEPALAQMYLRRQVDKEPNNVQVRCRLCEMQFRNFEKGRPVDMPEINRLVDDIEKLNAQGPFTLYAKAVRDFVLAKNKDPKLLQEARDDLEGASEVVRKVLHSQPNDDTSRDRSNWAAPVVLAAEICELQDEPEIALNLYVQSVYALGVRDNDVIGRAARLFLSRGRLDEAKAMFDYLESRKSPLLDEMHQEYVFVKVFRGDVAVAEKELDKFVAPDCKNYKDFAWQGQMYALLTKRLKIMSQKAAADAAAAADHGRKNDTHKPAGEWKKDADDLNAKAGEFQSTMVVTANKAIRSLFKALSLNPQAEDVWTVLARLYVDVGQPERAKVLIPKIEASLKSDKALTTVARCCELLNDPDEAEKNYQKAVKAFPQNSHVLRQAAAFYLLRQKSALAEPLLRAIVTVQTPAAVGDACWARRILADLLVRGSFSDYCKGLDLLDENLKISPHSSEDNRLKARYLARDPRKEKLNEALECMKDVVGSRDVRNEDRCVLAQLYLRTGNKPAYEEQMHALIGGDHPEPMYLRSYIGTLLDRKEFEDADRWLQVLEKAAPDASETMCVRAEYFFRKSQYTDLANLVQNYVFRLDPQSPDRGRQVHLAAQMLDDFARRLKSEGKPEAAALVDKAEKLFRSLRNMAADGDIAYAQFCARQGRIGDAMTVFEQSWDRNRPELMRALATDIIASPETTAAQFAELEKLLLAAEKAKHSTIHLIVLSSLYERQRQYDKAIDQYREILATEPRNYLALNNLAVALVRGGGDTKEALADVNKAIDVKGPMAAIRDSRAVVYVARREYDKALDDINAAIRDEGSAEQYFHQACVFYQLDRKPEAAEALKTAESKGLDPKSLSSYEKPFYDRLKENL
jgi:tetratricopeptide (TPR) repeat protein